MLAQVRAVSANATLFVKRFGGAGTNGASAHAAPVVDFGVHQRETVCAQVPTECLQMLHLGPSWNTRAPTERLQMLLLLADLTCTYMKTLCWRNGVRHLSADLVTSIWNVILVEVTAEHLQMPHLLSGSAYTYVRHCLRAGANGASASAAPAVPVNGFGVHLRETLCWGKSQRSAVKCLTCRQIWCTPTWHTLPRHVPTDICKCCTCQRIWRTLTWNTALAQVPTERLQMPHLPADLAYTNMKHLKFCLANGAFANAAPFSEFPAQPCQTLNWRAHQMLHFQQIWRTRTWNTAAVGKFGVHLRDTLPWRKYQWSACKYCTCQRRIWRTLTWNTVSAQVPTESLQMLHL